MQRHPLHSQRGQLVVEFLVAAPILALVIYGGMSLNQRLVYRQDLTIAARNALYTQTQSGEIAETIRSSGIRADVQRDGDQVGSQKTAVVHPTTYTFDAKTHGFDKSRVTDNAGDGAVAKVSGPVGKVAGNVSYAMDGILHGVNVGPRALFGHGLEILPEPDVRSATATLAAEGKRSGILNSLQTTLRASERGYSKEKSNVQLGTFDTDLSKLHYLRMQSAYHPDGYQLQSAVGYLVARFDSDLYQWGDASGDTGGALERYNKQCLMNFDGGGDRCTNKNLEFLAVRAIGTTIRAILDLPIVDVVAIPVDGVELAFSVAVSQGIGLLTRTLTKAITKGVLNRMKDAMGSQNLTSVFTSSGSNWNGGKTGAETAGNQFQNLLNGKDLFNP